MITPQNIFRHELIGLSVKVVKSPHREFEGINGKVIDETKNTIKIEEKEGKEKIIPKKAVIFQFILPDGIKVEIDGKIIAIRPEDRIKKRYRKHW
ncbi:MAG: Ribonuclease P protein component 1 [Methanobacterium sp. PtaU1.Bin242]|nr:MAG: Ribonuclease P protein component 1 [Methanobacterium sp. PtaU1.Bin242]